MTRSTSSKALMIVIAIACLGSIVAGCSRSGAAAPATTSPDASRRVVATVDGKPVLRSEVDETVLASTLTGRQLSYRQALNAVIKRRLVEAQAAKLGVSVPDAALRERLSRLVVDTGGQEAFEQALSSAGLTTDAYLDQLRGSMLAERVADRRFSWLRATPAEALAFYRRHRTQFMRPAAVRLRDIATKTKRMAQEVEKRLAEGADFAAVARQLSADPETKQRGGMLGWVRADSLPAALARAVATLKVGETSRPASAIGGWHVLRLLGRRPAAPYPFSRLRDELRAELTRRKRAAALARLVEQARTQAQVDTTP